MSASATTDKQGWRTAKKLYNKTYFLFFPVSTNLKFQIIDKSFAYNRLL